MAESPADLCARFGVEPVPPEPGHKLGISRNIRDGVWPISGIRHPVEHGTCGWYVHAGEYSKDPDFYIPLHVKHVPEWCPLILPYLHLPPGWGFVIAPDYEDVWFDPKFLKT